ncbi:hypothetical protein Q8F97_01475, partial [Klebsiella pneumoniae]
YDLQNIFRDNDVHCSLKTALPYEIFSFTVDSFTSGDNPDSKGFVHYQFDPHIFLSHHLNFL